MKKIFMVCFILISSGFVQAKPVKEEIVDIFNTFIKDSPGGFTMIPLEGNDLLKDQSRYSVLIDTKNFYIRITDSRLSNGDGTITSAFTYFTRKKKDGIIAVTHTMSDGDSGGNDPDNKVEFFEHAGSWQRIENSSVMPELSFRDFFGQGTLPAAQYQKLQFRYILPRIGTDFVVFALEDRSFRHYGTGRDELNYTLDAQYSGAFNNMKYIGLILKWNAETGRFEKKGTISNTDENRKARFTRDE